MMKRLISLLTAFAFLFANPGFAADGASLAPALRLGNIGDKHHKNFVLAQLGLSMDLEALDKTRDIDKATSVDVILEARQKSRGYVEYAPGRRAKVTAYFNQVEHIGAHIFAIPVSVTRQGHRYNYKLLFSTIRNDVGRFPTALCRQWELERLKAAIVVQDRLPERAAARPKDGEIYRQLVKAGAGQRASASGSRERIEETMLQFFERKSQESGRSFTLTSDMNIGLVKAALPLELRLAAMQLKHRHEIVASLLNKTIIFVRVNESELPDIHMSDLDARTHIVKIYSSISGDRIYIALNDSEWHAFKSVTVALENQGAAYKSNGTKTGYRGDVRDMDRIVAAGPLLGTIERHLIHVIGKMCGHEDRDMNPLLYWSRETGGTVFHLLDTLARFVPVPSSEEEGKVEPMSAEVRALCDELFDLKPFKQGEYGGRRSSAGEMLYNPKLLIELDKQGSARWVARQIVDLVKDNPKAVIGLATGGTQVDVYEWIIRFTEEEVIDWSSIKTFNLDEYYGIPSGHPQSYRQFMNRNLFDELHRIAGLKYENTHVPNGEAENAEAEMVNYVKMIRDAGGVDLWLVGIGRDRHYAFLEPGADIGREEIDMLRGGLDYRGYRNPLLKKIRDLNEFVISEGLGVEYGALKSAIKDVLALQADCRSNLTIYKDLIERYRDVIYNQHLTYIPAADAEREVASLSEIMLRSAGITFYVPMPDEKERARLESELRTELRNQNIRILYRDEYFASAAKVVSLAVPTVIDNSRYFRNISEVPAKALTVTGIVRESRRIIQHVTNPDMAEAIECTLELAYMTAECPSVALRTNPEYTIVTTEEVVSRVRPDLTAEFGTRQSSAGFAMLNERLPKYVEPGLKVLALSPTLSEGLSRQWPYFTKREFITGCKEVQKSHPEALVLIRGEDIERYSQHLLTALVTYRLIENVSYHHLLGHGYFERLTDANPEEIYYVMSGDKGKAKLAEIKTQLAKEDSVLAERPGFAARESSSGVRDVSAIFLNILPRQFVETPMDLRDFAQALEDVGCAMLFEDSDSERAGFIFSTKVTFDNGFGVMLPKLAESGIKIGVVTANERQERLIQELNEGRPENYKIVYASSIAAVKSLMGIARYYYFRTKDEPAELGVRNIELIVEEIIRSLGRITGVTDSALIERMRDAARRFAEAA